MQARVLLVGLVWRQILGGKIPLAQRQHVHRQGFHLRAGERRRRHHCTARYRGRRRRWDKKFQRFVPGIRNAAFIRTEDDECRAGRPGTRMPGWGPKAGGLSDAELTALVAYLRTSAPAMQLPAAPPRGDAFRGAADFAQQCAGCHGADGKGLIAPSLANPVFQQAATDAFIAQTIRAGRENTPMPAFGRAGFSESQIGDLLAYIRQWQPPIRQAVVERPILAAAGFQPAGPAGKRVRGLDSPPHTGTATQQARSQHP